ncbi:MAG: DUF554 domain-containing protein [Chloroflexi bacterium]|nr:DUF554 domain-containing protein [Chloroflexota bacterium]
MTGTIINIITIIIGSTVGMFFGSRFPNRIRTTVIAGLGLFTAAIGMQMFLNTENAIIVLGSVLLGGILGEWWRIEEKLNGLGSYFEQQFSKRASLQENSSPKEIHQRERFMRGFLTASLLFCIGPMTILGSIQDGLTGDYRLLATKAVLDGFASLAFASSLGIGVLFSFTTVLVVQGGLSLLAAQAAVIITDPMMNEMTATGGLLLIGLAVSSLLEIKAIRVGNFLPALFLAPLIVALLTFLQ